MLIAMSAIEREEIQQALASTRSHRLASLFSDAARDATGAVRAFADAASNDIFTAATECEESVLKVARARDQAVKLLNGDATPNLVCAIHTERGENVAVDVVLLSDGRALAINGEVAMLCPSFAAYRDDEVDKSNFPTLDLADAVGDSVPARGDLAAALPRQLVKFESGYNQPGQSEHDLYALAPAGLTTDEAKALAEEAVQRTQQDENIADGAPEGNTFDLGDYSGELQKRAEACGFFWLGNCMVDVDQGD